MFVIEHVIVFHLTSGVSELYERMEMLHNEAKPGTKLCV